MSKKYLIETSAVKAALGFSSTPHERHFEGETKDGQLYGSVYVRMETIRRFACDLISYAELLTLSESISDAESWWGEDFGRKPKLLALVIPAMRRKGINLEDHETGAAAVEVAQLALDMIEMFDLKLGRSTANTCGCQVGTMQPDVDGNDLVISLSTFRKSFLADVQDCRINGFLSFQNPKGRTKRLLDHPATSRTKKVKDACRALRELEGNGTHISCANCSKIGDPVIAMEQPGSWTLVHVDKSYEDLCDATGRKHKLLRSNLSFKPKAAPELGPTPPPPTAPSGAGPSSSPPV